MRILITGGCGFLGSNLAAHALSRADDLLIFDNLSRTGAQNNLKWIESHGSFRFVHGDIRNSNDIERAVHEFEPDTIFHLAGQVAMTTSITNPRSDFETNTIGSFNLLEAVRILKPSATIIYSSTNKVYGNLSQFTYRETETRYVCDERINGFDETTPLEFHSPYGCSKGAIDQYMLDYARIFGIKTIVFRHSSMYGGRQFATYDQGWIGWFCENAIKTKHGKLKEPFTISGNGKQVRDVLHANDVIRLYYAAIERADQIAGQAFNVGGGIGNSLSLIELFTLLEEMLNTRLRYIQLPPRESDQKVFVADITKAKTAIGWHPQIPAKEGIANMIDWLGVFFR
jgi:CDP-paratose 2-epimerase